MGYTAVRSHTRNGHQVRSHTRRTNSSAVADVLLRDMDMVYERLDREDVGPVGGDPACPHPGWYPIRRCALDTPHEASPILAYACTHCAATRSPGEQVLGVCPRNNILSDMRH